MASNIDLDPSRYIRGPVLDVAGALALGIGLITAHNKNSKELPTQVKRAAKQLRAAVLELQGRWDGQRVAALSSDEDKRPADQREDRAFGALALRLEGLTLLPENIDEQQRATKLYARLFPNGLAFLKLAYERQWAECEQRMRDIGDGKLAEDLEELVGEVVLTELKAAHRNYGRALGITTAKQNTTIAPKVAEQLRVVQSAIGDYALQLIAAARSDSDLGQIVVACLRPLDDIREADARRGGGGGGGGATTTAPASTSEVEGSDTINNTTPIPTLTEL